VENLIVAILLAILPGVLHESYSDPSRELAAVRKGI
jgi:hypothetical protein